MIYLTPGEPIRARYRTDAGQTFTSGAYTIVDFEDEVYDNFNAVTTGASWKFTAPKTGNYNVSVFLLFTNTTAWSETESSELQIHKNGSFYTVLRRETQFGSANTYMEVSGSDVVYLDKDDYIDIRVRQSSGGNLALHPSANINWVTIHEVANGI